MADIRVHKFNMHRFPMNLFITLKEKRMNRIHNNVSQRNQDRSVRFANLTRYHNLYFKGFVETGFFWMRSSWLQQPTPIETHWSSVPEGNLTMNFEPVFSSVSLSGRNRQMTRMESSLGGTMSFSSAILCQLVGAVQDDVSSWICLSGWILTYYLPPL